PQPPPRPVRDEDLPSDDWVARLPDRKAEAVLRKQGMRALPSLRLATTNRDPEVRRLAVGLVGDLGPRAESAVPELIRLLEDPDHRVRHDAYAVLTEIGVGKRVNVLPAFLRAFAAANDVDRQVVLLAVKRIGRPGPADLDLLRGLLR